MKSFEKRANLFFLSAALLFFLLFSSFCRHDVQAAVPGIDVSSIQGEIDWDAVAESGVKFAMIRVGNTKFGPDEMFAENVKAANEAGIRVGAYVYSYALTAEEAEADAKMAVRACENLPISFPIAIDVEDESQKNLSMAEQQAIINGFCRVIQDGGYHPIVYSCRKWFLTKLGPTSWDRWVANYGSSIGFPGAMWQYSSSGKVPGIDGDVDMNFLMKDYFSTISANN